VKETVMLYGVLVTMMLGCAVFAVRATRLFSAALWLAGVSVLTAILLYLIGAFMMAVIELSLSVGLITILLVFAISMVGADSPDQPVSRPLNIPLVIAMLLLVIGLTLPVLAPHIMPSESSFTTTFWNLRQADVIAQIGLIFAGVLGVLGLLAERRTRSKAGEQAETRTATDEGEVLTPMDFPEDQPESELEKV
jgi:NADH:ubiquinone oxidoreductase subunit 6 (subunit J)